MNKIWLQYKSVSIRLILFCLVTVLLSFSQQVHSAEPLPVSEQTTCSDELFFSNAYYFIDVSDIAQVSQYFSTLKHQVNKLHKDNLKINIQIGSYELHYQYFDYPKQQLLKNNQELFLVVNKSLPLYREDRETIFFHNKSIQPTISHLFEVKNYKQKKAPLDKHVLFSRVKRKDRPYLKTLIQYKNEAPVNISPVLEMTTKEIILLITHYGHTQAKIVLEEFHIANYGLANTFSVIKFELTEQQPSSLTKEETAQIIKLLCRIKNNFTQSLPQIKQTSPPNYQLYYKIAHQLLPSRDLFEQYPVVYKVGQAVLLSFIGFLVLYLFAGRYSKASTYKNTTKTRNKNVL